MIVTKRQRKAGLPKRKLLVLIAPLLMGHDEAIRAVASITKIKGVDTILLPNGWKARIG